MELHPGAMFAGYRVEAVVGRGGMGVVYRAQQQRPRRAVALKVIAAEYSGHPGFRARFAREAELAASIEHPSIVPIHEVGEHDGHLFIAMRLVEGPDLGSVLRDGPLAPARAVAIVARVASALQAAHSAGLVHRDIKPANVLLAGGGDDEHVYLTDFGLARRVDDSAGLTSTGVFLGTASYAAPEQIRGQAVDARTDVYALGCVLYHSLTGHPPFARKDQVATLMAHVHDVAPAPSALAPGTPPALDRVVAMAMAKDPADRFGSATALARAATAALSATAACPSCLAALRPGAQFCTHCGAATPASAQPAATPREPAPVAASPTVADAPVREHASTAPTVALVHKPSRAPWVALVGVAALAAAVVVFVLSRAGDADPGAAALAPSPAATAAATVDVAAEPTVEVTPEMTPEATVEVTPEATVEVTPEPTPEPTAEAAQAVPEVPVERPVAFHTGTDSDKSVPAAYCRMTRSSVYCWTPNDGFTLRLGGGEPRRVRADEARNRGRLPNGYDRLGRGRTRSAFGFSCTSRSSGLSCVNDAGHGWTLPRYVGLPALY